MRFLRTNTDCRVTVGPFFDKTDGVTPETGLTVTSCKLTLMVDTGNVPTLVLDANATASAGSNDMAHVTGDDAGFYDLELTAAQTNYLGRAMLAITDAATHCPVFHEFMILPAMIYDSMILGTDRLDTNVTHIGDTLQTARDLGTSVLLSSGTGTGQISLASGGVTLANAGHGGAAAEMTLKKISVTNPAGNAMELLSTGSNGHGLYSVGHGTGDGVHWLGGSTGHGLYAQGGVTSGDGINAAALGSGVAINGSITGNLTGSVGSVTAGVTVSGTVGTFDALVTALNTAHGAGSWATATGFSTHSAADVRTELATELLVMTRLGTAIILDGAVYQFTTNALENAPGGSTSVTIMPVSGSATTGNVLDGGRIKGQYGAPLTGLTVTCTTTNAGVTSARDLTAYNGALAFVVFGNDDEMDYGTRIVHGSDITVSSNVATISSTASHVLNTALGENLRWCLREDTAAPSIVFAIGDYTCQRAPVTA